MQPRNPHHRAYPGKAAVGISPDARPAWSCCEILERGDPRRRAVVDLCLGLASDGIPKAPISEDAARLVAGAIIQEIRRVH